MALGYFLVLIEELVEEIKLDAWYSHFLFLVVDKQAGMKICRTKTYMKSAFPLEFFW